jgi:1,4-dihydroxy-2-naphthoyl-CoA synthase
VSSEGRRQGVGGKEECLERRNHHIGRQGRYRNPDRPAGQEECSDRRHVSRQDHCTGRGLGTRHHRHGTFTAEGTDFCAGNYIQDFRADSEDAASAFEFIRAIAGFDKPIVGAVQGLAVGIGTTVTRKKAK